MTGKIAKSIVVKRSRAAREYSFEIDGEEFPYFLSDAGISTSVTRDDVPAVTITIPAERIQIDDDLG